MLGAILLRGVKNLFVGAEGCVICGDIGADGVLMRGVEKLGLDGIGVTLRGVEKLGDLGAE